MSTKARGRGVAATFGLLLVLAGIAGAAVLWIMGERRPEQAVDGFARGPVGCTTTLEFSDTGTFYVFEERVGDDVDAFAECQPVLTADATFAAELLADGRPLTLRDDTSVAYDTPDAVGTSIARVEIDEPGRYDLVVVGADPAVVAAVGRDPEAGVDDLRRGAVIVGVLGVLLGALLLLLAGRRSKRAATYGVPQGPGWGPQPAAAPAAWPPEPPRVQQPVNPLLPPEPVVAEPVASEPVVSEPVASEPVASEPVASEPVEVAASSGGATPWGPPDPAERKDPPPSA